MAVDYNWKRWGKSHLRIRKVKLNTGELFLNETDEHLQMKYSRLCSKLPPEGNKKIQFHG